MITTEAQCQYLYLPQFRMMHRGPNADPTDMPKRLPSSLHTPDSCSLTAMFVPYAQCHMLCWLVWSGLVVGAQNVLVTAMTKWISFMLEQSVRTWPLSIANSICVHGPSPIYIAMTQICVFHLLPPIEVDNST